MVKANLDGALKFTPAEQKHLQKLGLKMMVHDEHVAWDDEGTHAININHWLEALTEQVSWRYDPDTEEWVFSQNVDGLFWFDDEDFCWKEWRGDSPANELGESEGSMEAWRLLDDKAAYALCSELPCPTKTGCSTDSSELAKTRKDCPTGPWPHCDNHCKAGA